FGFASLLRSLRSFMPGAQRTGASLSCFALRLKPRKTGEALVPSKHPFNNLSALRAQILTEPKLNSTL
ncbi:MAG: hypothetical protein LBD95_02865, partial [Clostridiales Family XIII bacterium]|nr:hypothetical protein [Clostridiales Family XIII bacterium]